MKPLGRVLDERAATLMELEFGSGMDEDTELEVVNTLRIPGLGAIPDVFYIPGESLLICVMDSLELAKRVLYYVGGEREAVLQIYSAANSLIVYRMENDERFSPYFR